MESHAPSEISKGVIAFFTKYVADRNISIMTKAEWEQLYFYCTVRHLCKKKLVALSTADLYAVSKHLSLTFSQASTLLKKCYRFEARAETPPDSENDCTERFIRLFTENAVLNLHIVDGNCIAFEILNAIAREQVMEIISLRKIFSDTSFNRNIVKLSYDGYLKLIGQNPSSILERLRSNIKTIGHDISQFRKRAADDDQETKLLEKATDMINNSLMAKTVSGFASVLSKVYGIATGDIGKIIFKAIRTQATEPASIPDGLFAV